jgi:hypothetical protein
LLLSISAFGVFYKKGHGHLGWTRSAVTADNEVDSVADKLLRPSVVMMGSVFSAA